MQCYVKLQIGVDLYIYGFSTLNNYIIVPDESNFIRAIL